MILIGCYLANAVQLCFETLIEFFLLNFSKQQKKDQILTREIMYIKTKFALNVHPTEICRTISFDMWKNYLVEIVIYLHDFPCTKCL